ncbi:MAG: hypothetical protein GF308_02820 [Candidatus Heimdallarchaeota archaeon]|nr:hypothetical protein [Candidatus Heimdallarchaeota archaeon]
MKQRIFVADVKLKLIAVSDIHYNYNHKTNNTFLLTIVNYIAEQEADVILITGDIDHNYQRLRFVLKIFKEKNPDSEILFVPGNHDIWRESQISNSSPHLSPKNTEISETVKKYYHLLPNICRKLNIHYLPNNPIILENIGFIGSIGWYDYSYRNRKFDELLAKRFAQLAKIDYSAEKKQSFVIASYALQEINHKYWQDKLLADWGFNKERPKERHTDISVCQQMMKELQDDYSTIKDSCEKIVVGTHCVPFQEFIIYKNTLDWDYFSAFMGSEDLGEFILSNKKIRYAIFGHTHYPTELKIKQHLTAICTPIGLQHEFFNQKIINTNKYRQAIKQRIAIIKQI